MKLYKIYLDHGHAHVTNDTNLVRVRTRNWKSIIMRCDDLLQKKMLLFMLLSAISCFNIKINNVPFKVRYTDLSYS